MTIAAWIRLFALILVGLALVRLYRTTAHHLGTDDGEAEPLVATVQRDAPPGGAASRVSPATVDAVQRERRR